MWFFYPVMFCEHLLLMVSLCASELCQLSLAPLVSLALYVVVFLLVASSTYCVVGPHGSHPRPSLSSLGENFVTCWSLVPCHLWRLSGVFGCCSAAGFQLYLSLTSCLACLSPCFQSPSRSPTFIPNSLIFLSAGSRLSQNPYLLFLLCSPFFPYFFCLLFSLAG